MAAFQKLHAAFTANPGRAVLGAWAGDRLAAFATFVIVDDWVDIYPYADEEFLNVRPVNGLVHQTLDYFLVQRKFRVVSLGLSSVQEERVRKGCTPSRRRSVSSAGRCIGRSCSTLAGPLGELCEFVGAACASPAPFGPSRPRKAAGMLACYLGATPCLRKDRWVPRTEKRSENPQSVG